MNDRSAAWNVGWAGGAGVVVIAGGLLLANIVLGRRITRQAGEITALLDRSRENTSALFALTDTARSLERVTTSLRTVREGA